MIAIKIQCACGQRYAFDVEPVNGRMPVGVACPACGIDGTVAANRMIAQALGVQPAVVAAPVAVATAAPAPVRLATAAAAPPPIPAAAARPAVGAAPRPAARPAPTPKRGRDGWDKEENSTNKMGTYVMMTPALLAAMFSWDLFGTGFPPLFVWAAVGICGVVGGILNVAGRGPIAAGAVVGLVMALGGFGVAYLWLQGRERVYKFELFIAFLVGAAPGFGLQYLLQVLRRKRAAARG
jgi:hypothetical protein